MPDPEADVAEIPVQMGLFGGANELVGMHVVEAHTRVLHDGTSVFVAEHLRWNRPRGPLVAPRARPSDPAEDQPSLFGDRSTMDARGSAGR